jgi:hypothetical protein
MPTEVASQPQTEHQGLSQLTDKQLEELLSTRVKEVESLFYGYESESVAGELHEHEGLRGLLSYVFGRAKYHAAGIFSRRPSE